MVGLGGLTHLHCAAEAVPARRLMSSFVFILCCGLDEMCCSVSTYHEYIWVGVFYDVECNEGDMYKRWGTVQSTIGGEGTTSAA
jgi:hypothetical protein